MCQRGNVFWRNGCFSCRLAGQNALEGRFMYQGGNAFWQKVGFPCRFDRSNAVEGRFMYQGGKEHDDTVPFIR